MTDQADYFIIVHTEGYEGDDVFIDLLTMDEQQAIAEWQKYANCSYHLFKAHMNGKEMAEWGYKWDEHKGNWYEGWV